MRLWSIHPKYLDRKGLVACWREALLAQEVILGNTIGYKNHPQLERFKNRPSPIVSISYYLWFIYFDSQGRGYKFDSSKIKCLFSSGYQPEFFVTQGQLDFEFDHLETKLYSRDREKFRENEVNTYINNKSKFRTGPLKFHKIESHPMFTIIEGKKENWEKG